MSDRVFVSEFRALRPAHAITQDASLAWLAAAHARAEAAVARSEGRAFDEARFREHMARRLARFGCRPEAIAARGHEIPDCAHTRWGDMAIYRLDEAAHGLGMTARTRAFDAAAGGAFTRLYAERDTPPDDLVHVTCTGYASPSAAQRLVAARGWGARTRVTHAYHMGCYAAMPALRIARGLVAAERGRRSEIVHTELCSLHLDPLAHDAEQLVVQSLFADGFIGYAVSAELAPHTTALEVLAIDEIVVPDSSDAMTWLCSDWGMQMTLARDVPERLARVLGGFLERLGARAGVLGAERSAARYAVHPGGPRILDRVRDALVLEEPQLAASRDVLRACGNMSSATLPHVWQRLLHATDVEEGQLVVSLAFGPGLTLCGAILRKVTR